MESLLIGLDTLKVATRNFSGENKLGEGGFGPVYKVLSSGYYICYVISLYFLSSTICIPLQGKLFDGREIAVKRLSSSSGQGLEELKTEVILVAKLLHRNLVRLLGFCLEENEKLLVYEYLPNGSLDKILFGINNFAFCFFSLSANQFQCTIYVNNTYLVCGTFFFFAFRYNLSSTQHKQ